MIKHLALIMDGNRRWARKNNLMPWLGHAKGVDAVHTIIEFSLKNKIEIVSLYAFSLENLKRSPEEISYLFSLVIEQANKVLPDLIKNEICVKFIGNKKLYPDDIAQTVAKLEESTKNFNKLILNVLFFYGGQQEIVEAARALAIDACNNKVDPNLIDKNIYEQYLWCKGAFPDLIIRTGGLHRLSNFLLYEAAYSELYFTNKLWPEITNEDLIDAIEDFKNRKRSFGG